MVEEFAAMSPPTMSPIHPTGRTFEIKGKVAGLGGTAPNQTFTVNGVSFTTNGSTVLKDLSAGLSPGLFAEVKTQSTTPPFLVTRIEGPVGDFDNPENEIRGAAKASVEGIAALSEGALDVAPLQSYFKTTF